MLPQGRRCCHRAFLSTEQGHSPPSRRSTILILEISCRIFLGPLNEEKLWICLFKRASILVADLPPRLDRKISLGALRVPIDTRTSPCLAQRLVMMPIDAPSSLYHNAVLLCSFTWPLKLHLQFHLTYKSIPCPMIEPTMR